MWVAREVRGPVLVGRADLFGTKRYEGYERLARGDGKKLSAWIGIDQGRAASYVI
jgi:hypothetical protein